MNDPYDDFRAFVQADGQRLLRTAYLLTGDKHGADDLLQSVLTKLAARWPQNEPPDNPTAYTRTALYREAVSWWRVRRHHEIPWSANDLADLTDSSRHPDRKASGDFTGSSDTKIVLHKALLGLPPRQRAVVVLRFYEDRTEAETADILGCSVGAVKNQAHRALKKLRIAVPELAHNYIELVESPRGVTS